MKINYADYIKNTDASVLVAEAIFSELELTYPLKLISEVAKTTSGGTPLRSNPDYYDGDIPWLKSGELNDSVIEDAEEFITEKGLANSSAKLHPPNTLLLAMYGATAGRTGIAKIAASTNQAICALFPKKDIEQDFLFWFLRQHRYKFIEISKGGAQPNISQSVINLTKLPLPPKELQIQIALLLFELEGNKNIDLTKIPIQFREKVSKVFTSKNNAFKINDEITYQLNLVKKLRQQFLQDAVQGKLVEQDPNDEPASVLLKKIKAEKELLLRQKKLKRETELSLIKPEEIPFDIPKNWIWCRMGETGNLKRGKSKHRPRNDEELFMGGTYPFIQTGDVSKAKNNQDLITTINGYYNEFGLKQSEIQSKGTLCITIAANIAECGFLNFDACVPDSIVCFQAIDNIIEKYVYYYLKIAKEHLEKFAPATAQKNINLGILNDLPFPFPPLNEQYRIIQKVEELMQMCSNLEASIKQSQLQNEQLLQQVLREALTKEAKPQSPSIKEDIPETKTSEQYAALLLAAEIIWQLNQKKTLGHIKLQKLIYLCNRTQQMNLPVSFLKQAMGPYDPQLQRYLDQELKAREWFQYNEEEPLKYKMLKKAGGHKADYKKYFAGKTEEINHLVQLFENSRSAQIEIVATLFWCWDEMLTNNQLVNDAALLAGFYKWSEFKGKYSNEKVIDALRWMEGQGITPKTN